MAKQYSLKAFLRHFGEEGEKLMSEELTQFHNMETFVLLNTSKSSSKERTDALAPLMFSMEKIYGRKKDENIPMYGNNRLT